MSAKELTELAKVRPWGSVLMGRNIRCDGEGYGNEFDRRAACFSHIHEDHIRGFKDAFAQCDAVITSPETKDLLIALLGRWLEIKSNFIGLEYGKSYQFKGEKITLFRSNHILGSSEILVETENGRRILYSSDFNMPGATIVKDVDVLVLDSTHGEPRYSYDIRKEEMLDKLISLVKEEIDALRPVIIRTTRGKMQCLMHVLRDKIRQHISFISKDDDRRLADVYAKYGMPAGEIIAEESSEFDKILKKNEPYVRFYPLGGLPLPCEEQGVRSIRVGHLPEYQIEQTNMFQINLSDHASFDGIMEFVAQTSPQIVITDNSERTGGLTAITLAAEIKNKLNIEAITQPPLKRIT